MRESRSDGVFAVLIPHSGLHSNTLSCCYNHVPDLSATLCVALIVDVIDVEKLAKSHDGSSLPGTVLTMRIEEKKRIRRRRPLMKDKKNSQGRVRVRFQCVA